MGISLVPKDVALSVDGKIKHERKPKHTNADLPFPRDSYSADLKFWQTALLPEFLDWIATKEDSFGANADPQFNVAVTELWQQHFSAYPITPAVYAQVAAAFGKAGVKAVGSALAADEFTTVESRADHVRDELFESSFVYEDKKEEKGAYRSELILRTFASHLSVVLKTDTSYGHPVGAMAISCAVVERALHMHKTGVCSADGVERKGKRSAHNFVAVPWGARAKAYLPGIKKLSTQKWSKIIAMARPFIDSAALITADDTEDNESEDSRGLIQVSDDSD
ncbi:hypothetical protein B0H16DRAFT_1580092 [Mycena metata]|uniref:Uncharacterized protein n=1 Tax=Mycena metata TaxID=1033252 RepID=A0AAD7MUZ9_9AGAR|nr:hypothetical protein B0H16DRAFT_1580092 [Mycena metata]